MLHGRPASHTGPRARWPGSRSAKVAANPGLVEMKRACPGAAGRGRHHAIATTPKKGAVFVKTRCVFLPGFVVTIFSGIVLFRRLSPWLRMKFTIMNHRSPSPTKFKLLSPRTRQLLCGSLKLQPLYPEAPCLEYWATLSDYWLVVLSRGMPVGSRLSIVNCFELRVDKLVVLGMLICVTV